MLDYYFITIYWKMMIMWLDLGTGWFRIRWTRFWTASNRTGPAELLRLLISCIIAHKKPRFFNIRGSFIKNVNFTLCKKLFLAYPINKMLLELIIKKNLWHFLFLCHQNSCTHDKILQDFYGSLYQVWCV